MPPSLRPLRRLFRQPPHRWRLALEAIVLLVMTRLLLLWTSPKSYLHLLGRPAEEGCRLSRAELGELAWAVHRVSRLLPRIFSSFPQALTLQRMLLRRDSQGTVRIGVQRRGDRIVAHAWLVLDDHIVLGAIAGLDQYSPFPGWPRGGIEATSESGR